MPKGITPVKLKRLSGGRYTVSVSVPQRTRNMDCEISVPTSNRFNLLAPTDPAAPQGTLKLPKLDKPEHFIVLRENISKLSNIPLFKNLPNRATFFLTHLFNICIIFFYFPDSWKIASLPST